VMPEEQLFGLILNGGANVAFAMFLLWQYKEQQKRADDRETKNDQKEKDIRERYDRVIAEYQSKEIILRDTILKEISNIDKRLVLLEQKTDQVSSLCNDIKNKFVRVSP